MSAISLLCVLLLIDAVFTKPVEEYEEFPAEEAKLVEERGQTGEVGKPPKMIKETKERSFFFGRRNSHCSRTHNVRWHVKATPGWEIDIHSIKEKVTVKSSRSNYDGIGVDKTKDGFFVTGRVINSGNCIKVFGKVVTKDGRGSLNVSGTYIETQMVPAAS